MFTPFSINVRGSLVTFTHPVVMGILNVTTDSFYAHSRVTDVHDIERRAAEMAEAGAEILDIGAYSSRPGASDVPPEVEARRLAEGVKAVRRAAADVLVSVDTFRASSAAAALDAGADIVNDISGGDLDPQMWQLVALRRVPYVIMHMRGVPSTMQSLCDYDDVTASVAADLSDKARRLHLLGVADVIADPGFGFSKDAAQNFRLMRDLEAVKSLTGLPLLVGVSRKSMIYRSLGVTPEESLAGTVSLNTIALMRGASILRVHDVREAVAAVKMCTLSGGC